MNRKQQAYLSEIRILPEGQGQLGGNSMCGPESFVFQVLASAVCLRQVQMRDGGEEGVPFAYNWP